MAQPVKYGEIFASCDDERFDKNRVCVRELLAPLKKVHLLINEVHSK